LTQVQIAIASRIERPGNDGGFPAVAHIDGWEAVIPRRAQIDLDRFDFRLGLRSLALSEL
jgi:hypothetical protein